VRRGAPVGGAIRLFGFAAMSYPCCPGKRGDEHGATLDATAAHANPLRLDKVILRLKLTIELD
jgi:hypothetical protein